MDNKIMILQFSDAKVPEFKEVRGKDWLYYGENDDYPDYLLMLYNKSAKHGAIVNNKVTYIYGNGLKASIEDANSQGFLDSANPAQSWNELARQTLLDIEVFGGFYWQVIPSMMGKEYVYLLPFSKVRVSKDGQRYYFKHNWKDRNEEMKTFPAYYRGAKESTVYQYKEYRPSSDNRYALPGYMNACNYIESDVEVSKHTLTNAKTGFSASKFINFYDGEPTEESKRSIQRRFENAFTGSEGKKIIIGFNNDPNKKPTVDDLGQSDLTKEDFSQQDELITANIYAGHQVTSPTLFGIQEPGKLGNTSELKLSYTIFKNTYANNKQKQFEEVVNYFAANAGVNATFELEDVDPIGFEITDSMVLAAAPKSWVLEKMGIDSTLYPDAAVGGNDTTTPAPVANEALVNENLKNLTGRQHQQLLRIVRQFGQGKITRDMACTLLRSSLGLSDDEINSFLGGNQNFEATEDDAAMMFAEFGEESDEYEVIRSKPYKFNEDEEMSEVLQMFAEAKESFGILDYLKRPSPKFVIRYTYEKRSDAKGPSVLPTTRPFCRKMVSLNRMYSIEDIQKIAAYLGYDVFRRTGGFWNNNGSVEYHCRHEWRSNLVIKKDQ